MQIFAPHPDTTKLDLEAEIALFHQPAIDQARRIIVRAGVSYPLVADSTKTISANYDVLAGHYDYNETGEMAFIGTPQAYRGLFLIDRDGIVRHQLVNDRPLGRRIADSLRMVDALQHFEEHGETCPANWEASA